MKCSIEGCSGEYEERKIVHTVRHQGQVVVIDHVPAEVCSVCGDVLLKPETVRLRVKAPVARRSPHRPGLEDFPHPVPRFLPFLPGKKPIRRHPDWRITLLPCSLQIL